MDDSGLPWDGAAIRAVLDRPTAFYQEYARRPNIKAALDMFRSERDVHQTERLDLVTWVQYICGFGCQGPSENAWTQLFLACRLSLQLRESSMPSLHDLASGNFLREHEIAVLLAHAKVAPDASDAMTHAALIKHRIRPAVFGRKEARTPGIIHHVCMKFEEFIFGYMTKWMCHFIVQTYSSSSFIPGRDDLSPLTGDTLQIKNCADAHATKEVKDWGAVVMVLLDIDDNTISPRAKRFEQKVHETRAYLYQQFYMKISEFWLNSFQNAAAYLPVDVKPRHYRSVALGPPSKVETLFYAACTGPGGARLTGESYSLIKSLCAVRAVPLAPTPTIVVPASLVLFELHAPKLLGEAGLEFVPVDDVQVDSISLTSPVEETDMAFPHGSTASVRLGSFKSPLRKTTVRGVPRGQMCRALQLTLLVALLPPEVSSSRPQFRVDDITKSTWVELEKEHDHCEEQEPCREMNMEFDDDDSSEERNAQLDPLHETLCKSGLSNALAGMESCAWKMEHVCTGLKKYRYYVDVPKDLLAKVRASSHTPLPGSDKDYFPGTYVHNATLGRCMNQRADVDMCDDGYPSSGSSSMLAHAPDDVERFVEHVWIDCHTGAQTTYRTQAGIELSAESPQGSSLFDRSPVWRWRRC